MGILGEAVNLGAKGNLILLLSGHDAGELHCYAPLLIFGTRTTYLYYFISYTFAYHLCVLPARLSTLLDLFWT